MFAILLIGSTSGHKLSSYTRSNLGVRFINDSQYDTPVNPQEIAGRMLSDPTFEISKFTRNADAVRPGWSGTSSLVNRIDGDSANEFGQADHEGPSGNPWLDATRTRPCDKPSADMEELTSSWMNDPDAEAVAGRLDALDKASWAQSAK